MRHIKGLRIDWNAVEGDIKLPDEFLQQSIMFRADVLRDWRYYIEQLYDATVQELHDSFERKRKPKGDA